MKPGFINLLKEDSILLIPKLRIITPGVDLSQGLDNILINKYILLQ